MLTAKDVMTKEVISVQPDLLVEKLAAILLEHKIGGAPVVDADGTLLGVVTESDLIDQAKKLHIPTAVAILDAFMFLESTSKMEKEFRKMAGRTVHDICSKELISVEEDTPLNEIATIMAEKMVHTLPVVKNGQLCGVVGKTDLIKAISNGEC